MKQVEAGDAPAARSVDIGRSGSGLWMPALLLLGVLVPVVYWFPLARITMHAAISYNEGWNTYWQRAAAAGQPLYAVPPRFTIVNYPPLSFHLIGWLGNLIGATNLAGRIVALASLVFVSVTTGAIARCLNGSTWAGLFAALLLLGWIGSFTPERVAMNDPQFLAILPELLGLYLLLGSNSSPLRLVLSAVLFAVSIFTKDNLVAVPIAAGLTLLLCRDWKGLAIWVGVGAVSGVALLVLTLLVDGRFFLDHLLRARAVAGRSAVKMDIGYIRQFGPALLTALVWLPVGVRLRSERFLALSWALALVIDIGLSFGDGVAHNTFFEAMALNAAVIAVAGNALMSRRGWFGPMGGSVLVALVAVWPAVIFPPVVAYAPSAWRSLPELEASFQAGVRALRTRSGPAWCENLLMCQDAGKPPVFDAYFTKDQMAIGLLPPCTVLRQLADQVPAAVQISPDDKKPLRADVARRRFTRRFLRTLLRYYAPVLSNSDGIILARRDGPWRRPSRCQATGRSSALTGGIGSKVHRLRGQS